MNDNDIIKALECCANANWIDECEGCPLYDTEKCINTVMQNALDLINRQKAEIEKYEKEHNEKFNKWMVLDEQTRKRYAELYEEAKGVVRAEAIKGFAERLKESISNMEYTANIKRKTVSVETLYTQVNWVFHEIVPKTIDSLVKEMTEEQSNDPKEIH